MAIDQPQSDSFTINATWTAPELNVSQYRITCFPTEGVKTRKKAESKLKNTATKLRTNFDN